MEPMRPIDQLMIFFQTDNSPMNIGGLLLLDTPEAEKAGFEQRIRAHLEPRALRTVIGRRLIESPEHYDSDTWFQINAGEIKRRIFTPKFPAPLSYREMLDYVTGRSMQKLELDSAPFEVYILDNLEGPRCAIYLKVHHCVMDGIGFQSLIQQLSDQGGDLPEVDASADEPVPAPEVWKELARQRFEREGPLREASARAQAEAQQQLGRFIAESGHQRGTAPLMAFGAEITRQRTYNTVSFSFNAFRATAKGLGATINDVFLATASGALRSYLLARGQLPEAALIGHCVSSTRRPEEHGLFGNRVVSIYPELATEEADAGVRLARIRAAMNLEKQRARIEEPLQDMPETPYGARDRRIAFADPSILGAALGSANVVLSNVTGPEEALSFAGFRMAGNYPVPIVGPDRFLNITSRRNADRLDMGVMVDAAKITEAGEFVEMLKAEFARLEAAAGVEAAA